MKKLRKHLTNAPIAVVFALAIFLAGAPSAPITEVFPVASSVGIAHASMDCNTNPECGPYDLWGESLLKGAGWLGIATLAYKLLTGRDLIADLRDFFVYVQTEAHRDNAEKLSETANDWCDRDPDRCQEAVRELMGDPPTYDCIGAQC